MKKIELGLGELISKLNMVNGFLKGITARISNEEYLENDFEENMADIRMELQICIDNLTDKWLQENK